MLKKLFKKWKLVNTNKYLCIPVSELHRLFILSKKEFSDSETIREEKGEIEYTFYPIKNSSVWGVKVKVWNTNEYIDITDYSNEH